MSHAMKSMNRDSCPVCDGKDNFPLLLVENVPILSNFLYASQDEAFNAPLHAIELCCCRHCTHIHNIRFDQGRIDYRQGYENTLFHSPLYQAYAAEQAQRLIKTYGLRGRHVIDIGCGGGEFLQLLQRLGNCAGTGYDPSLRPDAEDDGSRTNIRLVGGIFPETGPEYADLYVSRHVLEHLDAPRQFLQNIRKNMDPAGPVLYIEVPNGEYLLRSGSVWDIIYEHYSFFTGPSLEHLVQRSGFSVKRLQGEFGGQYITLDAEAAPVLSQPSRPRCGKNKKEEIFVLAEKFFRNCRNRLETARCRIREDKHAGRKMAIWGAGSKGISFLNRMQGTAAIDHVIDINPLKQGKYVPGTGQKVMPPEFLAECKPDTIFVANEIYENEIRKRLRQYAIAPELVCI